MKQTLSRFPEDYAAVLRNYLTQGARTGLQPALGLGRKALALKLNVLALARVHERALSTLRMADRKGDLVERTEKFFTEAIVPIVATHRPARQSRIDLKRLNHELDRRTADVASTSRQLQRRVARCKLIEEAAGKSGKRDRKRLRESLHLQKRLRQLTHRLITTQEDHRKHMSRELQEEVLQYLLGINVRLLSLKQESRRNTSGLKNQIAGTQRMVASSMKSADRSRG